MRVPHSTAVPAAPRRCLGMVVGLLAVIAASAPLRAEEPVPIYRVFLTDGTALASYGEFAQVGERVVFTMPLGGPAEAPHLHAISLPSAQVDWDATSRYRDAVRYAIYARTRGEDDFRELVHGVAEQLEALGAEPDRAVRLARAARVRQQVADWPRQHYGYRSRDVRDVLALLDAAVSELRIEAGDRTFDLALVATIEPPSERLLPPPTPAEAIELVLAAALHADVPSERLALLEAVLEAAGGGRDVPPDWAERLRARARVAMDAELRIERAYASLVDGMLARASGQARRADPEAVARVLASAEAADLRLGRLRPSEMSALAASIERLIEAARALRREREEWRRRAPVRRAYARDAGVLLRALDRAKPALDRIRELQTTSRASLARLAARLASARLRVSGITAPSEFAGVHATASSALHLAAEAVRLGQEAAQSGDARIAWDASAAAAGALMLGQRARTDMDTLFRLPELR